MRLAIGPSWLLRSRIKPSKPNLCPCFASSAAPSPSESRDLGGHGATVREGQAEIFVDSSDSVFYNKAQVNNRDLSISVLRAFISKRREEAAGLLNKNLGFDQKVPGHLSSSNTALKDLHGFCDDKPGSYCEVLPNQHAHELDCMPRGSEDIVLKQKNNFEAPKVLEALAASGLRAIRYAREVDGIGEVIALDNNEVAIEACKKNIQHNGTLISSKVVPQLADARVFMLTHPKEFDVIDLDPYGSPAAFLDSAVQSVADGGILMCSATDMAVLAGGNGGACFSKYGSYPLRGKYCHEMALRILLACIESHANRYKRFIVPVLSVHMDFYVRVFVRIFTLSPASFPFAVLPRDFFLYISQLCSASATKSSPLKRALVYQCVGCDSYHLQSLGRIDSKDSVAPNFGHAVPYECSDCGKKFVVGGPIWSAPIHDQEWVGSVLSSIVAMKHMYPAYAKISAVLTAVSEELPDAPLFVSLHNLCLTLKCTTPTVATFRSAVINAGYQISGSHVDPLALKTNAPMSVIWDIMRCWVKIHPVKDRPGNHSGIKILSREPVLQADFSQAADEVKARKRPRFVPNPQKYWGPKSKAGRQPKHTCELPMRKSETSLGSHVEAVEDIHNRS